MKKRIRYMALVLMLALMISLCACTGNETEQIEVSQSFAGQTRSEAEPAETELLSDREEGNGPLMPDVPAGADLVRAFADGERIYFQTRQTNDASQTVQDCIYVVDKAGNNQRQIVSLETVGNAGTSQEMWAYLNLGVKTFCTAGDGSIWLYKETSEGGRLVHLNDSGETLAEIDTATIQDGFYADYILPAGDDGVVISTFGSLIVLDSSGNIRSSIATGDGFFEDMTLLDDGTIAGFFYDTFSGERTLRYLDMDSQTIVSLGELSVTKGMRLAGGTLDELWLWGGNVSVYERGTESVVERMNWNDAGFSPADIAYVQLLPDNMLLIGERKMMEDPENMELYILSADYSMGGAEKTTLRLAGVSIPYEVTEAVIAFNRTNGDYYIETEDYSNYNTSDNYSAGEERLLYEINTGELPDILLFTADMAISPEEMTAKGYLEDIGALMDADADIHREDYLENVMKAAEIDGTLYTVIGKYYLDTVVGRSDIVDAGGCSIAEVQAWAEENPGLGVYANLDRNLLLSRIMWQNMDVFTDSESGTCGFDTPAFAEILKFAKELPAALAFDEAYYADVSAGNYLFYPVTGYTFGTLVAEAADRWSGASEYVGYPSQSGAENGAIIVPTLEIGICVNTDSVDGCWAFVKQLLTQDYGENAAFDSMPLRYDVLEAEKQTLQGLGVFTDTQLEEAEAHLLSATTIYRPGLTLALNKIILEEAEAYFSGTKTAEEAASLIQSRASIYMAEQG